MLELPNDLKWEESKVRPYVVLSPLQLCVTEAFNIIFHTSLCRKFIFVLNIFKSEKINKDFIHLHCPSPCVVLYEIFNKNFGGSY